MDKISDQTYLVAHQYRDGTNLAARGALFERCGTNPYQFHRWLFDQLRLPPRAQVLELGCGTGVLWLKNAERIPAGWEVILSDLSQGMLRSAQSELQAVAHPFAYAVIDAQAIPYPDATFDAVFAHFMLFHVPDRSPALGEIRRVLRPGGSLYAATRSVTSLRELAAFRPSRESDWGDEAWGGEAPFTLENGRAQLKAWFPQVDLHRYDNTLVVTEPEPLLAHLLSRYVARPLDADERAELAGRVQRALTSEGAIRATWRAGLFVAW